MKIRKVTAAVFLLIFMLVNMDRIVWAQEDVRLMQTIVQTDCIEVYVDTQTAVEEVSAQIGRDICENIAISRSMETEGGIHTLIFLDNSLSITQENQRKISSLLGSYFAEKNVKEAVSLYLFGENANELVAECYDSGELEDILGEITYINQDSWLTDVVYDGVKKHMNHSEYIRIVVISDGVDNKSIGYTKEELQGLLKETGFPLYAVGCVYKDNQSELENFFALSRQTAGKSFVLDEYEGTEEIKNAILDDADVSCISIPIPEVLRDGSEKNVLVKLETEAEAYEVQTKVQMPFGQNERTEETEVTELEVPESVTVTEETIEMQETVEVSETETFESDEASGKEMDWFTLGAIVAIAAALIALLGIKLSGGKSKKEKKGQQAPELPPAFRQEGAGETAHGQDEDPMATMYMGDSGETVVLQSHSRIILKLQDMKQPDKVFQYPLLGEVYIGRAQEGNQIILDYDRTVSGKQCKVFERNGAVYVVNLSNVNGTYVNELKIVCETQISTGDIITMGNLRMKVVLMD